MKTGSRAGTPKDGIFGTGIIKGLRITLGHFIGTYLDDLRWFGKRYYNDKALRARQGADACGVFTVQYPEERLPVPEEFRFIPFLIYEEDEDGNQTLKCTACGICAKVCPPQCIWIVRERDEKTGRPRPNPVEFSIDIDICMNCGLCAEYCPFDSIKMDHAYELAAFDRSTEHIYDLKKLSKPTSYYEQIRPSEAAAEVAAKAAKKARKRAR